MIPLKTNNFNHMKTLAEHILDIAQNSVRAKATLIEIIVEESKKSDLWTLTITDNGCGMEEDMVKRATDPFFTSRTTRKVGLGLALLQQNTSAAGGTVRIKSKPGEGTVLKAEFQLSHIDRPPVGNIGETLYLLFLGYTTGELQYEHKCEKGTFSIRSSELHDALGEVPLQNKEVRDGVIELIKTNLEEIGATK